MIRAEAVAAIAAHGTQAAVLAAARDPSWRVRLKVAVALGGFANADHAKPPWRRMLNDPGAAEVERQVVRSLAAWPLGDRRADSHRRPCLEHAVSVRKLAAEQLASRWQGPSPGAFPCEAPPARRAEALAELRARYQREYGAGNTGFSRNAESSPPGHPLAGRGTTSADDDRVAQLIAAGDFAALTALGQDVVGALERLAVARNLTLPEPVFHDVLPRYSPAFAALDRMHGGELKQRRQAAEDFSATARIHPPGSLATARLCALVTTETDPVVWIRALEAIDNDASEPAVRMARLALSQNAGEVRRKACEFLASHPDAAHEAFLLPLLNDREQAVVLAAIRALGAAGRMTNTAALKNELAASAEDVQLAAAIALPRLRDPAGDDAIRRLSYPATSAFEGVLAQDLGDLGDERFISILVRLLDDSKATVSHAALASLSHVKRAATWLSRPMARAFLKTSK